MGTIGKKCSLFNFFALRSMDKWTSSHTHSEKSFLKGAIPDEKYANDPHLSPVFKDSSEPPWLGWESPRPLSPPRQSGRSLVW